MEQRLKEIFEYTNSMIIFAESKNAALSVANITLICAIGFFILEKSSAINILLLLYFIISLVCLASSLLITFISFIPKLSTLYDPQNLKKAKSNNINTAIIDRVLIYFGDISSYTDSIKYILDLYKRYEKKTICENDINNIENDYAKEIIYNSKIAKVKYEQFLLAMLFTIGAIFTPLVALIILAFHKTTVHKQKR